MRKKAGKMTIVLIPAVSGLEQFFNHHKSDMIEVDVIP